MSSPGASRTRTLAFEFHAGLAAASAVVADLLRTPRLLAVGERLVASFARPLAGLVGRTSSTFPGLALTAATHGAVGAVGATVAPTQQEQLACGFAWKPRLAPSPSGNGCSGKIRGAAACCCKT